MLRTGKAYRFAPIACGVALAFTSAFAHADQPQGGNAPAQPVERQLEELKAAKKDLVRVMQDFETRIDDLEARMQASSPGSKATAPPRKVGDVQNELRGSATATTEKRASGPPASIAIDTRVDDAPVLRGSTAAPTSNAAGDGEFWGRYQPGKGFILVRDDDGELAVGLITYLRYLNQLGLDRFYTDSFGRTKELHLRQDFLLNKANLSFKGWLFDPDFEYRIWIWTQNPAMGQTAQVVVGGHMGYHFEKWFNIFGGVAPLPTDRTTNWTYPFWLKMDNRTIADEFFRGSYSFGIWADGEIDEGLLYRVMIANNLSALGVDAGQLDADFGTLSGTIWWMPTTGEYGFAEGFGDYDYHEEVATRFGVHYTRSREDAQSQPNQDDFDNAQLRLSDGTLVFSPDPFGTGGQIRKATYQMFAANAGFKYEGWALEGEYYVRWVDEFETTGFIPVDDLFDTGVSIYGSGMIVRDQLQIYAAGSQVFGEYGDPWDLTVGLNWYPFSRREVRFNAEGIYLDRSPVGGNSYPYLVGGNGWLFNTDFILAF